MPARSSVSGATVLAMIEAKLAACTAYL